MSPDGQMVAFMVMVDRLTQLAVLQVTTGDWEVRTSVRSEGYIRTLAWKRDGSTIFFDRTGGPRDRVFSVPAVGGPERLVLDNARLAESLPDGSVLVARSIGGRSRLHRFWPDTAKEESLPAIVITAISVPVRALPGGRSLVYYGLAEGGDPALASSLGLHRMNLDTKTVERLAPDLELRSAAEYTAEFGFPLGLSSDGRSALIDLPSGDLHRIIAVALDDSSPIRTLLTTAPALSFDVGADGSIYLDPPITLILN